MAQGYFLVVILFIDVEQFVGTLFMKQVVLLANKALHLEFLIDKM